MNKAKERLKQFIDNKGLTYRKFYEETGLSNSFLSNSSAIGSDNLEKIFSIYPDLDVQYIITGIESYFIVKDRYNSIGPKIKVLRLESELTSEDFAKPLGITADEVTAYESGVSIPAPLLLAKICKFYYNDARIESFMKIVGTSDKEDKDLAKKIQSANDESNEWKEKYYQLLDMKFTVVSAENIELKKVSNVDESGHSTELNQAAEPEVQIKKG